MLEPVAGPLRRAGLSPELALRAGGLQENDLSSPATRLSIDQILAVYRGILAQTRDPALAYRLGLSFHITGYGMYGFAILSSLDVRHALEIAIKYHRLGSPLTRAELVVDGERARWTFQPIPHPQLTGALYEFVTRLHLGIFVALHGEAISENLAGFVAGLAFHVGEGEAGVIEELTGLAAERSRAPQSWIGFDAARLTDPTRMGSAAVNRMLLEICDAEIEALRRREGMAGRLRTILIANGCRVMSIGAAARRLGMSERGLRRRLAAEGTSFRAVLDDTQLQAAVHYLRDTELTADAIAELLGFSDDANFRRAFRRWTGRAPTEYRTRNARVLA